MQNFESPAWQRVQNASNRVEEAMKNGESAEAIEAAKKVYYAAIAAV